MADNEDMELEGSDEENDSGNAESVGEENSPGVFIPGKTQNDGGELESDPSAYIFLHQLQAGRCPRVLMCLEDTPPPPPR